MDRPTILVIDYEPRNLAATVEPLTAAGYRVEVARDGVAGLDAFRRLQPHVVFMEAMLPKKHAFEVCQEIRRAKPGKQTRVFILGAPTIAQSQQSKAVHQYGADRFLSRPVDGPTLVALCSSVLPGPDAPQVPEMDLLEPLPAEVDAVPQGRLDLASMTEDDIMAQLDQLLPSVPVTVAAPPPAPVPVPLKAPSPPKAAAPRVQGRPAPVPVPVTRAAASAPVPPPAPRPAAPPVEAAPVPVPARSRAPLVGAVAVLALAAAGTWMLFRPGAAPVAAPAPAAPFFDEAPAEFGEPLPSPPVETPLAEVETAQPQAEPAPPPPAPAPLREAKAQAPPPERRAVVAKAEPAPQAVRPAEKERPPVTEPRPEPAASGAGAPEIPLPIAPPRLEPLPVGSDAARPRISPDIFRPKTQAGARVDLSEVDQAPVPVSRPAPVYPPAARQMRREGEIGLRLLVDAEGQVAAIELVTGSPKSDLAAAAMRAARTWRYRPAMKDGVPVQVRIVEKVVFKL